jgi:hypothetical protein
MTAKLTALRKEHVNEISMSLFLGQKMLIIKVINRMGLPELMKASYRLKCSVFTEI